MIADFGMRIAEWRKEKEADMKRRASLFWKVLKSALSNHKSAIVLCALSFRRGAAAKENSKDRIHIRVR
jgi:hypothetical protein